MDKREIIFPKTVFLSILIILLLSLMVHYTSDAFPPPYRGAPNSLQGNTPEGSSSYTDTQVSHPFHSAFLWAEPILLGILISLTYALIASSSNPKFPFTPPPERPPIAEPYST